MDDRLSPTANCRQQIADSKSSIVNRQPAPVVGQVSSIVVVVGPTAAGKTDLAIALAAALGGEIISADSRQIYRGMDIGTAKATPEQRARAPHHLLDVVNPDQVLTLAEYQHMAYDAITGVQSRGLVPILAGGTGQYVRAVTEGWQIPAVAPDPALRAALEAEALEAGAEAFHARLAGLDPRAAARIDYRNVRRVIRALEVCLVTGRPISELQSKEPPPWRAGRRACWIGVTRPRPELYARIDARVDRMIAGGLVEEVRALAGAGYGWQAATLREPDLVPAEPDTVARRHHIPGDVAAGVHAAARRGGSGTSSRSREARASDCFAAASLGRRMPG